MTHADVAPVNDIVDTESAPMATWLVLTRLAASTVVTRTDPGAPVATRSSLWASPPTSAAGNASPAIVRIGGEDADQARSEGAPAARRRSTIAAATTGTSARTCTA